MICMCGTHCSCRTEVLAHIATCLSSTPQTLGDPRKDTPEEMEERHERITAASLTAAAALLTTLQQQQQQQKQGPDAAEYDTVAQASSTAAAAVQEVQQKLQELLQTLCGTQLVDLHVSDLLNDQLPSHFDYTSQYDLLVVRRLAAAQPDTPAPKPAPKEEVKPDPVKEPDPAPQPVKQPEPAPKPAEQKAADAQPLPDKPDPIAQTIDAQQPEESVRLPDTAPAPQAKPKPQAAQAETAKAPDHKDSDKPSKEASSRPKSDDKSLDDKIAALLNKEKSAGGGAKRSTQQSALGGEKNTGGNKLSQNEMDALRQKLGGCWSIPAGVDDADTLKVSVRFRLDRSGELEGRPQVVKGGASSGPARTAAESAVRAVQKCAPFNLPADKYDTWSEIVVNFDPSDMLNGF